jgi:hypothetical protein
MKPARRCPMLLRSLGLSAELKCSLRRLEKLVDACAACPRGEECEQAVQIEDALVRSAHAVLEEVEG